MPGWKRKSSYILCWHSWKCIDSLKALAICVIFFLDKPFLRKPILFLQNVFIPFPCSPAVLMRPVRLLHNLTPFLVWLPFPSPQRWQRVFPSSHCFGAHSQCSVGGLELKRRASSPSPRVTPVNLAPPSSCPLWLLQKGCKVFEFLHRLRGKAGWCDEQYLTHQTGSCQLQKLFTHR